MTQADADASLPALVQSLHGDSPRVHVPERWLQGRTAFGGLSTALALAAVLRRWEDLPPLRSAQIAFIAPVTREVTIATELLRQGRSTSFAQADLSSEGRLALRATFVFAQSRDSEVDLDADLSQEPPPMGDPIAPPPIAFVHNFESRTTGEEEPGIARYSRWARLRDRDGVPPLVELLAIADVLPPAAMMVFPRPGAISSMSWQVNILSDRPGTEDGWWLVRASAEHAKHGVSTQSMSVRNAAGALVASGVQSVALFV
ncbi:MAG: thioesterase family protein [Sphingomonas sp.]